MRAYYYANKDKWKKYNREALARMTKKERAEFDKKQREYARDYYKVHREKVIERTTQYQQRNKEQFTEYRAAWYQDNKTKVAARRRQHYHKVVKPRQKKAKDNSEFVTISEAVKILGAKLSTFREWVYMGKINSVRSLGGRYLLRRADVEEIQSNIQHIPEKIRRSLGLSRKRGKA